jgi:PKD repeat protein
MDDLHGQKSCNDANCHHNTYPATHNNQGCTIDTCHPFIEYWWFGINPDGSHDSWGLDQDETCTSEYCHPPPPVADFSATPLSGDSPLSVTFTDLSTPNGEITAWSWDFDNNGVEDLTTQDPVFEYTTAGTYTVKLTVTSPAGVDQEIKVNYITVEEPAP